MGTFSRLGNSLYEGDVSIDFIGRKWLWYFISAVVIAISVIGLSVKGLDLGIEFKGGSEYTVTVPVGQATQQTADRVGAAVADTGVANAKSPVVNTSGNKAIKVQTESVTADQSSTLISAMSKAAGVATNQVSEQTVGPSYGSQVATQALTGLIVFLILVVLFIWAYFREWKMSVAALVALAHDVVITIGIYALSGFEVTPATVTGLLTILGFSLYDTVVVFDKVRENTKNLKAGRKTYGEAANLAVNQTLVRSVNTSIVALLPVGAILYVGVTSLGSGALKDLALALFVGMATGAYSSIFIATPLLAQLKSRERLIAEGDRRAQARARREVDRYADVPVFTEDMPVTDDPEDDEVETAGAPRGSATQPLGIPPRRREASGSGRVVPESKAPITESRASGRSQPTRQPRSKRPKK
jgi:preprotein translocase subunit SecF